MENEMIERVSRAVEAEYLAIATEAMRGGAIGFSRTDKDHLRIARAATEAMRESVMAILTARAALYRAKAERHMARGCDLDDDPTRAELATHAKEAMTWAEGEMTELFDAALAPAKQPA